MEYVLLIILWSGWCVLHSTMIALSVTRYAESRLGRRFRYYRLFYNIVAMATLLPLVSCSLNIESGIVYRWQGGWQIVRWGCILCALSLFGAAAKKYDLLTFAGIRQIRSGDSPAVLSGSGGLDTSGIHGLVRHPWYLAALLLIWSWRAEVTLVILIIQIILTAYLFTGTVLEERKLEKELGRRYLEYREKVSMFLPVKWFRARIMKNGGTSQKSK